MLPRRAVPMLAAWVAMVLAAALAHAPGPAHAQGRVDVAGVFTAPLDHPWVRPVHDALQAAAARGEIAYSFVDAVGPVDFAQRLEEAASSAGLVVGQAFGLEDEARAVAARHADTAFLMGSDGPPSPPNFAVFDAAIQDASYLTGIVAGIMTETGVVGMVGDTASPPTFRLMNAFADGVREVNPRAKFLVAFAEGDAAGGAAAALIGKGADILYADSPAAIEAAAEAGIFAIGTTADLQAGYPDTVIANAAWHPGAALDRAVSRVRAGTFTAEDYRPLVGLAEDESSLGPISPRMVSQDAIDVVSERRADILEGRFQVQTSDAAPASTM